MKEQNRQQSFAETYDSGQIPWDEQLPPPELIELAGSLEPGKAIDLGSGYGRSSVYLALRGWQVDGIEFVPQAVEESRRRAQETGTDSLAKFHVSDVTQLDFLQGEYDLAIDIGCMHNFKGLELEKYHNELKRLIKSGGIYLLFAHLRNHEEENEEEPRWIEEEVLRQTFVDGFVLSEVVHGITQVDDRPPWRSAWFQFHRI